MEYKNLDEAFYMAAKTCVITDDIFIMSEDLQ